MQELDLYLIMILYCRYMPFWYIASNMLFSSSEINPHQFQWNWWSIAHDIIKDKEMPH